MSFNGKLLHCSSLTVAVLMAMFVGSICLPTQSPVLEIDQDWSTLEAQDELKLKHVTSPSIQAPEFVHIGDMTVYHPLGDEQDEARERRNAVTNPRWLWPDGIVPYEISPSFSNQDREVILRSMKHWENNTCIRFRPKALFGDTHSIYIQRTPGCSSFVGRIPFIFFQPQGVSLGSGCVTDRIVLHELGHAIGFYHEHTRPDRDEFVDIIYDNIIDDAESQFYKKQPGQTNTLGLGYDLQSVMHYSRNTGSKNGSDTIRAKDPSVTSFGNSQQLSPLDIAKTKALYNCVQKCGANFTASNGTLQTPNWPQTYPINSECEWFITLPDPRTVVEITCDEEPYGIAGSYPQCEKDYLEIYNGHTNRDRKFGPYCEFTKPGVVKTTANLAKVVFHAGPSHNPSRRGLKCTFQSVPPPPCGGILNTANGSFQTPNWPATYPVNVDCEWRIQLPDARKLVELKCNHQPFGIAGDLPDCSLDYLKLYDGHDYSAHDTSYGPFCHFTPPEVLKMSSNLAMAVFHAGPSHSSSRRGFRCTFESVEAPTIPPPCGGVLNTANGSFQTPNWPETYPNNIDCRWKIELPDTSNLVELKCDHQPFGIAGGLPDCSLDYLKLYDGHDSTRDTSYGRFCHFTPPDTLKVSSNKALALFHAGPSHSTSRKGFRCTFRSLPSSPPPPSTPQCGGVLTTLSGSFQTQNWPSTYPVNVDCQWTIRLPNTNRRVELIFENQFGIAGSLPDCEKDHLRIYDDRAGTVHGPYCYFTPPPRLTMSSSEARVVFHAGPAHSPSRVGFKANYRSA